MTDSEIDESEVNTTLMRLLWVAHRDHMDRLSLSQLESSVLYSLAMAGRAGVTLDELMRSKCFMFSDTYYHGQMESLLSGLRDKGYVERLFKNNIFYSIKEEFIPHIIAAFESQKL